MTRFNNPVPQFFDPSAPSEALINGKLYFYEPGTLTLKDTYADSSLSIANSNPVLLDGAGRAPNIFLSGAYKVRLLDSDDVLAWERDPVGDVIESQWSSWDSTKTYAANDIVQGSDGSYYFSVGNGNLGNDPTTSPSQWTLINGLTEDNTVIVTSSDTNPQGLNAKIVTQFNLKTEVQNPGAAEDLLIKRRRWGVLLEKTGAQSIDTSPASPDLSWSGTPVYEDNSNFFNFATDSTAIVIPADSGITRVKLTAQVNWAGNATGFRRIAIFKDGSQLSPTVESRIQGFSGTTNTHQVVSYTVDVSPTAESNFRVNVLQNSGGALNVNSDDTWFEMEVIE